jgi:hypothetical protein
MIPRLAPPAALAAILLASPALAQTAEPVGPPKAAPPAPAPPPTEEARAAQAKETFLAGREALKQGDLGRALALFRESQELHPSPGTLLNMANCEEQLGLLAAAWQHFSAVLALLPPDDDRRPLAEAHVKDLGPRVPHVVIRLAQQAPAGTTVSLDDAPLPPGRIGVELALDPGRHTIVASAPDRPSRRYTLTITEGQHLVSLVEPWYGAAFTDGEWGKVEELSHIEKKPALPPPVSRAPQRIAGYSLSAVGLVSLGIGAASGAMAIVVNNQLKAMCPKPASCTASGVGMEQIDRGLATMSTVTVVMGIVGLGVGIPLVASGRDGPAAPAAPSAEATAIAVPGGGMVGVRGRF